MKPMHDVPRSKIFDDIYFSAEDGRAETTHVFLDGNDLPRRFKDKRVFTICETGFGTGLNFLMAWEAFEDGGARGDLHFISFEKYPLSGSEIKKYLSNIFSQDTSSRFEVFIAAYPSNLTGKQTVQVAPNIRLTIIFGDINDEIEGVEEGVDAWFLDGFAPAKNPDMWSDVLFENMARLSNEGATFATFTAAGFVKRGLQGAGFDVAKVKGFGRKREMLRGRICKN